MNKKIAYALLGLIVLVGIIVIQSQEYRDNEMPVKDVEDFAGEGEAIDHFDFIPKNWPPQFQVEKGAVIQLRGKLVVHNESTFIIYVMKDEGKELVGPNASWYMIPKEKPGVKPPTVPSWLEVNINLGKPINWVVNDEVLTVKNANEAHLKSGEYELEVDLKVGEDAPEGSYKLMLVIASPYPAEGGSWFVSINRILLKVS